MRGFPPITPYVGTSPTLCHLMREKRPLCCMQLACVSISCKYSQLVFVSLSHPPHPLPVPDKPDGFWGRQASCLFTYVRTYLLTYLLTSVFDIHLTFRASLSGTFLQTLPELVTPLKGHSLFARSCPCNPEWFGYS